MTIVKQNEGQPFKKCEVCNKSYKNDEAVRRHIKAVHFKKSKFLCDFCNKSFKYKTSLIRHYDSTHKAPAGIRFGPHMASFEPSMEEPIRASTSRATPKTFECKPCSKVFKEESGLRKHNKVKHEGNEEEITCKKCGKEFLYAWSKVNKNLT